MLRLLSYILKNGTMTHKDVPEFLDEPAMGFPSLNPEIPCIADDCAACRDVCPTSAIELGPSQEGKTRVQLDLGACVSCGLCQLSCPTGLIGKDRSTSTAVTNREQLVLSNVSKPDEGNKQIVARQDLPFRDSIAIRVVSTGCSACDLEIGAAFNPIFDLDRFGVKLVASPRMADALVVTGPVPRGMHSALKGTYEAMPAPKMVIAAGTCATSGGVHAGGYADANGLSTVLPVDVYIPGCPPHPWSIINGILIAMGKLAR